MSDPGMGRPPLLLWGPSRLVRELQAFCLPEFLTQWRLAALQLARDAPAAAGEHPPLPPPPPPLTVQHVPGGLLAQLRPGVQLDEQLLTAAASRCTLLAAAIQPLASAATLEAAAAAALARLPPGTTQQHPLRAVCLDGSAARAPAERSMRQRLQRLGLGSAPDPAASPLWCIQHGAAEQQSGQQQQQQGRPAQFLLGLQLAAGASPCAAAAARQLSPTAMLPELAAASCSLAAVEPGHIVLDPFCGTGSLLAAAADCGAALAVGSDIDATHFARGSAGGAAGGGQQDGVVAPVLMQAAAACLEQLLPAATVDAIVTDLPYGYRTDVAMEAAAALAVAGGAADGEAAPGAAGQPEDWQHLLVVLLRLARHVLVPGGRLLAWMPLQLGSDECIGAAADAPGSGAAADAPSSGSELPPAQQQQVEEQGAQHGLQLLHFLPESRQGGYPRAVAVFERQAGSSTSSVHVLDPASRRQQLLAALEGAAAGGAAVHSLPGRFQAKSSGATSQLAGLSSARTAAAADGDDAASEPAAGAAPQPAAVQQRGLEYKQVRGAAKGAAIDVWRCGGAGALHGAHAWVQHTAWQCYTVAAHRGYRDATLCKRHS